MLLRFRRVDDGVMAFSNRALTALRDTAMYSSAEYNIEDF